jgi:uncharacterized protein YcgI (DUF1989 family)
MIAAEGARGAGELLRHEQALATCALPPIPGQLSDTLVPARGFLPARVLARGDVLRIVDVEGEQVADLIFYDPSNLRNVSSMTNTMLINGTWKITTGHTFYAKFGQRMATIVEDTVGTNVVIGGFCNPDLNEQRYGVAGTHSCRANLSASMAHYGLGPADIEEGCWCPFMNVDYAPDGAVQIHPPLSRAGDHIDIRAEMDIVVAFSNCPSEHNPCNGWNPTALRVITYRPD